MIDAIAAKISRRSLMAAFLAISGLAATSLPTLAQQDPLHSWNDGAAKKAIITHVTQTTETGGPHFVPPADRIAVYDQDGTTWVEHPFYSLW